MPLSKKSLAGKGSKLASRKMSGFARTAVKDARRNTQRVASSIAPEDGQPPKPPVRTDCGGPCMLGTPALPAIVVVVP